NNITFGSPVLAPAGSASAPSYSFSGDPNTGIYGDGSDTLRFTVGGNNYLTLTTSVLNATVSVRVPDGSVSAPGLAFASDGNTGLFRISADNFGIALGGAKYVDFATGAVEVDTADFRI